MSLSSTSRIPSLDGLRAISILMVIAGHAYQGYTGKSPDTPAWLIGANAAFGVEVFFVISGYLITSLLLAEFKKTHNINLKDFYIRRTFRIFPALWFYIFTVVTLSVSGAIPHVSVESIISAVTFTTNYSPYGSAALEHTWSLSVEEQFYLLWPATLYVALRFGNRKKASILCAAIIVMSPILRVITSISGNEFISKHIYFMLHTRLDALMFGCLVALLVGSTKFESLYERSNFMTAPLVLFSFFISPLLTSAFGGAYIYVVGYTIECTAISFFMLYVIRNQHNKIGSLLNSRPAIYIGTLSYSLYLWQELTLKSGLLEPRLIPFGIISAFALADLSYRIIEQPGIKLRHRIK